MDYPEEDSKSLYDYSDKSVKHAGYAAVAYAAISLFSAFLAWIQYFFYHKPGAGGLLNRDFASQQYLPTHAADYRSRYCNQCFVTIIVVGFLLRGARRIFQDYSEQKMEAEKV
jgi:hypothetical protein